ncbi:hypothetical protein [Pseudoduganella aquatica]|uniref:Lipoprotein n=1 Tax=Pseudoduganella aquatica TaxID=2660641 RepID=A0A7X4KN81_9BURK|nr:hypothetical protein [Pseudoduganella aquatica]MYN08923.1 hypothetical protein [Pseudoduganella aquatica]
MNIKHTLLACALMALAGCASDSQWQGNGGTSSTSNTGSQATSSTSSTSSMAGTAGASTSPGMQSTGSGSGVVQSIDQITRQDAMAMGMSMGMASGAAAAGGTMGSPMDKVYRITVRMDDGTTQTVMAESMPSYKNGDRVRYANGVVTRE